MGANNWTKLLVDALSEGVDEVSEEWLTPVQVAAQWGKSESHTRRLLPALVQSKKIETRSFRIVTERGGRKLIPHYRLLPAKSVSAKHLKRVA